MKHVDKAALASSDEAEDPFGAWCGGADVAARLNDDRDRAFLQAVVDMMEQGVVFWSKDGVCELASADVDEMLELSGFSFTRGALRKDYFKYIAKRLGDAEFDLKAAQKNYASGEAFKVTRMTPNGRVLLVHNRPRPCGGYLVTLIDITEFHENEAALGAAKARAEKTERKLGAELARLNAEKAMVEARQEELQRLSLVAAHAKDLIVITGPTNQVIWANEAYRRHNGLDLEMDLIGKSQRDVLVGPNTGTDDLAQIDDAVRNRQAVTLELICYKRGGDSYWMEQEIIPVFNDAGEHTNFIIVGRDVSDRKAAENAAVEARKFENSKRAESRLLAEFNEWLQSSDTLDEVFIVVSSFLAKLLPGSAGAVYTYAHSRDVLSKACDWGDRDVVADFEPSDCWALRRGRAYYYGDNTVDIACTHIQNADAEPAARQYCLPIIAHGDTVGLLSVAVAETEGADSQKLANFCAEHISLAIANVRLREQLREQSTRDPLTGLYNRRFFMDYAKREIGRCRAQGRSAALISLDVDHFKTFNDTYGHDAGDLVLKALAKVLKKIFREADVPCRIGGEEFIVILPGASKDLAMERAEQLRETVEKVTLAHSGETLRATISAGVCEYASDGDNLEELMQIVDAALYQAKSDGRNQVVAAGSRSSRR
ncbi:MAG: diguanylate cyclase [Pseudomonadota bacterium]